MKKQDRKEIKNTVANALTVILDSLKLSKPSKRTVKAISRVSKALRRDLENVRGEQPKKTLAIPRTAKKKNLSVIKKNLSKNGTQNK